jgi:plastocyanin
MSRLPIRLALLLLPLALVLALFAGSVAAQDATVEVSLVDFTIEMPDTVEAGTITFMVTNMGQAPHNLVIEGQGISRSLESNLAGGQSGSMVVELAPGTYTVYCPVGGHRNAGMQRTLTVTGAAAGTNPLPDVPRTGAGGSQATNAGLLGTVGVLVLALVAVAATVTGALAYRRFR